jgi:hypothetical protein
MVSICKVATPLPAFTKCICMAMVMTFEFDDFIFFRKASCQPDSTHTASVPLFTMRINSTLGTMPVINSAISISSSVGAP